MYHISQPFKFVSLHIFTNYTHYEENFTLKKELSLLCIGLPNLSQRFVLRKKTHIGVKLEWRGMMATCVVLTWLFWVKCRCCWWSCCNTLRASRVRPLGELSTSLLHTKYKTKHVRKIFVENFEKVRLVSLHEIYINL